MRITIIAAALIASTAALAADRRALPRPRPAPAAAQATAAHALLSAAEAASIKAALSESSGAITLACGGPWCRGLADGLAGAFSASGWTVHRINHGGIGIDGVSGIRLSYCGSIGRRVKDLVAAGREVEAAEVTSCNILIDREVYVVVGTPK